MPAKTYTSGRDPDGNTKFTTYKVWFDGVIKSRTFLTEEEANRSYDSDDGKRLDKIVITVLRSGKEINS